MGLGLHLELFEAGILALGFGSLFPPLSSDRPPSAVCSFCSSMLFYGALSQQLNSYEFSVSHKSIYFICLFVRRLSLSMAGGLHQMTFKSPFQPKPEKVQEAFG